MRKSAQIMLTVHYPDSEEAVTALKRRVSELHAYGIHQHLQGLNCPEFQKLALLDAIIEALHNKSSEQM